LFLGVFYVILLLPEGEREPPGKGSKPGKEGVAGRVRVAPVEAGWEPGRTLTIEELKALMTIPNAGRRANVEKRHDPLERQKQVS